MALSQGPETVNGSLSLEILRPGHASIFLQLPAGSTAKTAAEEISRQLGMDTSVWKGLRLIAASGQPMPPEAPLAAGQNLSFRLGITHTSALTGR